MKVSMTLPATDAAAVPRPLAALKTWSRHLWLALIPLAAVAPLALTGYQTFQLAQVLIFFLAILGLNLLTGYCGQLSLGHGAFFALGAYTAVVLLNAFGLPWWLALVFAAAFSFVAGFLFGWPALRLDGPYLALATFALAIAVPQLLKHEVLAAWTGGVQGVNLPQVAAPAWWPSTSDHWFYLVCLGCAALGFSLVGNLVQGRIGRAIAALREHPVAATAMGINRPRTTAVVFGISAMTTGLAGALGAFATQFVSPDSFNAFLSISLLVGAIVGGLGTRTGPLFGAIFIQFMPRVAEEMSKAAPWAIYGMVLMLVVYLAPEGIAGRVGRWKGRA
jgi:branched-chain amino acid transport system permease protein